jgi:hypothetical protein
VSYLERAKTLAAEWASQHFPAQSAGEKSELSEISSEAFSPVRADGGMLPVTRPPTCTDERYGEYGWWHVDEQGAASVGQDAADQPANCTSPLTHRQFWHDISGLGWYCVAWACLPDDVTGRSVPHD